MNPEIIKMAILLALMNSYILYMSFKDGTYRRLLPVLGVGFGLSGLAIMTTIDRIGTVSTPDPTSQGVQFLAFTGTALILLGLNNGFLFGLMGIMKRLEDRK